MVMANLSEGELIRIVDDYFKDVETGELKLKGYFTAMKIVEIYCNLPIATREKLYFMDYLAFNVHLYDSLEEAVDDGINLEEYEIVKNKKLFDENDPSKAVVLIGDWKTTLD